MSIQDLIDEALIKEEEIKSQRIRSGKFSPSSFGKCYRAQYWNRKNEPKSNPIDVSALRRFKVGNIIHQYAQSFFPNAQREVLVLNGVDMVGYADIVLENEVIDIKSSVNKPIKGDMSEQLKNINLRLGSLETATRQLSERNGKPFK